MKRFIHLIISLTISIVGVVMLSAQAPQKTIPDPKSPKIIADKPGVFITFEKFGERPPVREGEGTDGIWLRLHNNMRYPINFCIFGLSRESTLPVKPEENTQIGVYYDVVSNPRAETDNRPLAKIPFGYPVLGTCQDFNLKAGRFLRFAVPKEHLADGLSIKIGFHYGWENVWEPNPTHYVHFLLEIRVRPCDSAISKHLSEPFVDGKKPAA